MHILLEEDGSTNMTNHNKQYIFAVSIMDFEYIIVQGKIRQYLKPHEHFFGRLSPVEFATHFEHEESSSEIIHVRYQEDFVPMEWTAHAKSQNY